MKLKRKTKKLAALCVLVIIICAAAFLLLRPPAVIVTDNAFITLYGAKRVHNKQYSLFFRLLRRARLAVISDDAGQDAAVFAIGAVSKNPSIVIFPERFAGSAVLYAETVKSKPGFKPRVYIARSTTGAALNTANSEAVEILEIDRETDLYRAGLCAAFIAKDGEIEVFDNTETPEAFKKAFKDGLSAGGYEKEPRFKRHNESINYEKTTCIVILAGYNSTFFSSASPAVPAILFTWFDPEFTPEAVKIVFDDSPLGIAPQAARGIKKPHSEAHILMNRIGTRTDVELIVKLLAAKRS